jgi:hypothetical protein
LSEYQKYQTRTKVIILIFALACAEQHLPGKHGGNVGRKQSERHVKLGLPNPQTVELWYRKFRLMHSFTIGSLPGKHNLPPFFQETKDVSLKIQAYTR